MTNNRHVKIIHELRSVPFDGKLSDMVRISVLRDGDRDVAVAKFYSGKLRVYCSLALVKAAGDWMSTEKYTAVGSTVKFGPEKTRYGRALLDALRQIGITYSRHVGSSTHDYIDCLRAVVNRLGLASKTSHHLYRADTRSESGAAT